MNQGKPEWIPNPGSISAFLWTICRNQLEPHGGRGFDTQVPVESLNEPIETRVSARDNDVSVKSRSEIHVAQSNTCGHHVSSSQHCSRIRATDKTWVKQSFRDFESFCSILKIVPIWKFMINLWYLSNNFLSIRCIMNLKDLLLEIPHNLLDLVIMPRFGNLWEVGLLGPGGGLALSYLLFILDHIRRNYLQSRVLKKLRALIGQEF